MSIYSYSAEGNVVWYTGVSMSTTRAYPTGLPDVGSGESSTTTIGSSFFADANKRGLILIHVSVSGAADTLTIADHAGNGMGSVQSSGSGTVNRELLWPMNAGLSVVAGVGGGSFSATLTFRPLVQVSASNPRAQVGFPITTRGIDE